MPLPDKDLCVFCNPLDDAANCTQLVLKHIAKWATEHPGKHATIVFMPGVTEEVRSSTSKVLVSCSLIANAVLVHY
jgi:hypothetical protein